MRNILDTLKREHEELRQMLAQLSAAPDDAEDLRTQLLHQMEAALIPHAKWEELTFYPALAERASHEQLALQGEAMQEHRAVEQVVLPDLHAADITSRQFAGSARALEHMLNHHVHEEETQIFTAMSQLYTAEELAEMDERYEEWKDSAASTAMLAHAKTKTAVKSIFRSPNAPG
jgi:hemerythrin-like domain-containing protein